MASPETLDVVEKTIDAIDETLETIERIPKVNLNGTTKKQQYIILLVTAMSSAFTGGFAVHTFLKKNIKLHYEEISNREIAEAKKFYAAMNKVGEYSDPKTVLEKVVAEKGENEFSKETYVQKVDTLAYKVESPSESEKELEKSPAERAADILERGERKAKPPVIVNVFADGVAQPTGDFDYEAELAARTPLDPYVIHHDEFYEGENEYTQVRLTYYEGDDVLADDRDQPVDDSEATVGNDNLNRFGYGSQDPNIVYIRNDRLEIDFEVAKSSGSFVKNVLGFIENSEQRGSPRKSEE